MHAVARGLAIEQEQIVVVLEQRRQDDRILQHERLEGKGPALGIAVGGDAQREGGRTV